MTINLTLIGQMITFIVFIWFTMRYVWPPMKKAMEDRQAHIAKGLEMADKAKRELELAHHKAIKVLKEAKHDAAVIKEQANKRAGEIVEAAKEKAREESGHILDRANVEVDQVMANAKASLRAEVADLAVLGAEKIMRKSIDKASHDKLLDELVTEL
jgi:F-type H+-transporting ATPase subunit b